MPKGDKISPVWQFFDPDGKCRVGNCPHRPTNPSAGNLKTHLMWSHNEVYQSVLQKKDEKEAALLSTLQEAAGPSHAFEQAEDSVIPVLA